MEDEKTKFSSFSPFSRNEFLEENPHTISLNKVVPTPSLEQPSSIEVFELSEESTMDNPPSTHRKYQGRPSGSRNKPKPPMVIMENSIADVQNVVLEIPIGNDVVDSIIYFARSHEASIVVMKGSGLVSDITLLQPNSRIPAFQLDGPFNVLSLAGAYLNLDCGRVPHNLINDSLCTTFSLQLSGSRGQVFGGVIGGKINAASDIHISAILFKRPGFHRVVTTDGNVQLFEDDDVSIIYDGVNASDYGGVEASETQSENQVLP
ncbi:hypothetical protein RYX36_005866 [Vicia faba]